MCSLTDDSNIDFQIKKNPLQKVLVAPITSEGMPYIFIYFLHMDEIEISSIFSPDRTALRVRLVRSYAQLRRAAPARSTGKEACRTLRSVSSSPNHK